MLTINNNNNYYLNKMSKLKMEKLNPKQMYMSINSVYTFINKNLQNKRI